MSSRHVPDDTILNVTPEAIDAFERGERLFAFDDHGRRYEIEYNFGTRSAAAKALRELGVFTFKAGNELN